MALRTNNLTKVFNDYTAVNNLELNIPDGSVYGFLGPNGAGKTTTIKMLTGLIKPTHGYVELFNENLVFGSTNLLKSIGYLPDVPHYYKWMNATQFLTFCGELFEMNAKKIKIKIPQLLELVGLPNTNKKISTYSRGMKQRLGIAQSLINDPKIIFLDEPTSALDPIGRREILDIIKNLSTRRTVFFSTHILSDAEEVCDKILIINKGKKVLEDTVSNIKNSVQTRGLVIELEDPNNYIIFKNYLEKENWLNEIFITDNKVTIIASDIHLAQITISKILFQNNLYIKSLNIIEPTLEDIFMKVVKV